MQAFGLKVSSFTKHGFLLIDTDADTVSKNEGNSFMPYSAAGLMLIAIVIICLFFKFKLGTKHEHND